MYSLLDLQAFVILDLILRTLNMGLFSCGSSM